MPNNTVVYRDIDASQSLTQSINKKISKLNRYSEEISSSRVVLEAPHQHKHKGKLYRAQIELAVKGNPVIIHNDDESIHVAVRDVFKKAERKIKELNEKRHAKGSDISQLAAEEIH